ncbi:hypothetical protein ACI65C_013763 [Semiaphis heraclei]
MKTQLQNNDVTDTENLESSDPAGVGELATPVVITSSDNAQSNWTRKNLGFNDTDMTINRNCYEAPLRLRGGGDDEMDNTDSNSTSGDMGAGGSQKRGPTSPGGLPAKLPRTSKETSEINDLIGFLEQAVLQEKDKKKLGVMVAEKMLAKIARLRTVTQTLAHENCRLAGELKGKEDALNQSRVVFIGKLETKNSETCGLRAELEALKTTTVSQGPSTAQQPSYASKAAKTAPRPVAASAPKASGASNAPKSKKTSEKEQIAKSRSVKATSRFMVEIPSGMTVAGAKTGIWETVRSKLKNPRAKTIMGSSNIDLTLATANLDGKIRNWAVSNDTDSDHNTLSFELLASRPTPSEDLRDSFNEKKADWQKFQNALALNQLPFNGDVHTQAETLTNIIRSAAIESMPLKRQRENRVTLPPWWNSDLVQSKRALNLARRNNSPEYAALRNRHLNLIKSAKMTAWWAFSDGINNGTWGRAFNWAMKGTEPRKGPSTLKDKNGHFPSAFCEDPATSKTVAYADDIVVMTGGARIPTVTKRLEKNLDSLIEWSEKFGLTFSTTKCEAMTLKGE